MEASFILNLTFSYIAFATIYFSFFFRHESNRIDCTYRHFEHSSSCPTCGRGLNEDDFTELVVAESTGSSTDLTKSSLQTLFSKSSQHGSKAGLPLGDMCQSLMTQQSILRRNTTFLMKQLLIDSSNQGRRFNSITRVAENLKGELTKMKQMHSAQRLQFEQTISDYKQRLQAREAANAELNNQIKSQENMINQFRKMSGLTVPVSENSNPGNLNSSSQLQPPMSASQSRSDRGSLAGLKRSNIGVGRQGEPPLKGLMANRAHHAAQQQQSMLPTRTPLGALASRNNYGNTPVPVSNTRSVGPNMSRPYSSSSQNSAPATPRIRDLTPGGFNYSGAASNQYQHLNKRRRGGTPTSSGGGYGMSPNTAFTLNNGPRTGSAGQRFYQNNGAYSRR
jgi:hypothetical protein